MLDRSRTAQIHVYTAPQTPYTGKHSHQTAIAATKLASLSIADPRTASPVAMSKYRDLYGALRKLVPQGVAVVANGRVIMNTTTHPWSDYGRQWRGWIVGGNDTPHRGPAHNTSG